MRFLQPVDEDYLAALMNRYETAVFVEEGVKSGGFGEYASELALRKNCSARIIALNAGDRFFEQGGREELLERCGLDGHGIAASVCSGLGVWGRCGGTLTGLGNEVADVAPAEGGSGRPR
ncbi:MAG: hypothetical protein LBH50_05330 [Spirochaetaceae bacterium]|nr:hypothetical protein [Spirochaetaceae bacterium]